MITEEWLGRVRAIAWQAADYVPTSRMEEVYRLIDHGESAEGLCSLAWAIVTEKVQVPLALVEAIREHTADMIDDEFMPPDLDNFANTSGEAERP